MTLVATPEQKAASELLTRLFFGGGSAPSAERPPMYDPSNPSASWKRTGEPDVLPKRPLRSKEEIMAPYVRAQQKGQELQNWIDQFSSNPDEPYYKGIADANAAFYDRPSAMPQASPDMSSGSAPASAGDFGGIEVDGKLSELREGVLKGPFSVGKTGGNILGILGDAFLTQAGHDPRYQPRVREAREAEALAGFSDNPEEAINRLITISPDKGLLQQQNITENAQRQAGIDIRQKQVNDEYENNTHTRAGALIGAATKENYPAMRKRYYDYYVARGITPMVELPETFKEAQLLALRKAGMSPEDQATIEEREAYHNAVVNNQRYAEAGRGARAAQAESGRMGRFVEGEKGKDRRLEVTEAGRDRRNSGRKRPVINFSKPVNGKRQVIQ